MKDEGRTGQENNDNLVDGKYSIEDLVNLEQLRNIFEKFTRSTGFTIGFLDHPGLNILIATGWRDICTKFHRACPASMKNCIKSNAHLLEQLKELGQIVIEECDNGLVDCATPIIIKGKHIASLATGQLLLKQPDIKRFKRQASMFGYDEQKYLQTIKDIPVVSEEKLKSVTSFLGEIAVVISDLGYTNLYLKEEAMLLDKEITERKVAEKELQLSEHRFRQIFDNIISGIAIYEAVLNGEDFIIKDFNNAAEKIDKVSKIDIIGKTVLEVFPGVREFGLFQVFKRVWETGKPEYHPVSFYKDQRITGWRENYVYKLPSGDVVAIYNDVTERKQAEEVLEKLRHQNELILNSTAEGIAGLDLQGISTFVNPSAAGMLGYEVEELIGKHSHTIWHHSKADGSTYPEDECPIYETLKDGSVHHNIRDEVFWRKDGTSFPVAYSSTPIIDNGKIVGAVVNFRDITERKYMAEKLQYLAYYDALTDLPNRNLFFDRVNQAIARAEPTSRIVAVLITNINRFKSINDTYGSEIGDRVLKEIAGRLSTSLRKGDTIARLSNDEFGIALLDVAHPDDIVMVLEKIIKDISYPLKVEGDELALTFSTGVSLYPNDGNSASELLKAAGLALGTAKKERIKPYQFFTEDLNIKASELVLMEKGLLKAITNEEFILHYQPYWDITTKKMVGMEALIRWQSKNDGLVPPGKFIPVLEDTGMIIEVGEWILREAMRQVKEWQNNGYPVVPISVNLSLIQFRQKDLAEMVNRIIRESGFYPSLLTLEITESAFMQDIALTNSVLKTMKDIGVSVSIDDFGTGYSSLAHLKRFPIDNLKIDMSFIRELSVDPDTASIVMAIIAMAHSLNLKTIAEGIETEEQWKILRLLKCDMGQGYYFSKPLPAQEVERFFTQQ